MRSEELILGGIIALAVLIGLFLLLRELVCWYYKINERIRLQKETIRLLKKLAGENNTGALTLSELNEKKDKGEVSQEEYLKLLKTIK